MSRTIIIAEAGVNHNGSMAIAKQLVDAAVFAGADYVKFQTFIAEKLVIKEAEKAAYQKINLPHKDNSQFQMLKNLELKFEQHFELINYCKSKNIKFLSTAFDLESLEFLSSLQLDVWKIPSGEITNYPYLKKIAQKGKPVFLSTGMSTMCEIRQAIEILTSEKLSLNDITLLHCNTEYPTPMEDVNLRTIHTLCKELGVKVGYSDHTLGIEVPIAAVSLGATVIEKHFTLNRNLEGPDHKASLEPDELKAMVDAIRSIEKALGSSEKIVSPSEAKNMVIARKSIVAASFIPKGERFSEENLTTKRPGSGISPMMWNEVIGRVAIRDFHEDELIEL